MISTIPARFDVALTCMSRQVAADARGTAFPIDSHWI